MNQFIEQKPLQIEGIRALVFADVIKSIVVHEIRRQYYIVINGVMIVSNRQNKPRSFSKFDTLIHWLRELGLTTINAVHLHGKGKS